MRSILSASLFSASCPGVSARISGGGFLAGLLHPLPLALDHPLRFLQLLHRDSRAGIDRVRLLELDQRLAQLALSADDQSFIEVTFRGVEVGLIDRHLVLDLRRVFGERLLVILQRHVPVLFGLLDASLGEELVALFGFGLQRRHGREQHKRKDNSG